MTLVAATFARSSVKSNLGVLVKQICVNLCVFQPLFINLLNNVTRGYIYKVINKILYSFVCLFIEILDVFPMFKPFLVSSVYLCTHLTKSWTNFENLPYHINATRKNWLLWPFLYCFQNKYQVTYFLLTLLETIEPFEI